MYRFKKTGTQKRTLTGTVSPEFSVLIENPPSRRRKREKKVENTRERKTTGHSRTDISLTEKFTRQRRRLKNKYPTNYVTIETENSYEMSNCELRTNVQNSESCCAVSRDCAGWMTCGIHGPGVGRIARENLMPSAYCILFPLPSDRWTADVVIVETTNSSIPLTMLIMLMINIIFLLTTTPCI